MPGRFARAALRPRSSRSRLAPMRATHRHLHHIREIFSRKSSLSARVREQALAIFTRLAEAEGGGAYGTTVEKVHFH